MEKVSKQYICEKRYPGNGCNIAKTLGLKVGHFTANACIQKDEGRISSMSINQSEKELKRITI